MNAYNLTLAVLLLPAAALGDRFGRRRMFTGGLVLFVAASAVCALAPDAGSLIAARAVQGAGAALVIPNALALVSAAFPAERRGSALGILQGITGLAVVAGPVIGGAVAEGIDWEWIFWLNVPIGLAAIPLALVRIVAAADMTLANIVRLNGYTTDVDELINKHFPRITDRFGNSRYATSVLGVAGLPAQFLVMLEATAVD